jgi:hypothetical protein
VRALFLVVGALLVAQAAYAYTEQEPFPSFVFPSFPGAPDDGGSVRVLHPTVSVRFEDAGSTAVVSYQRLLQPAPGVVADAIAYTVFAPRSSESHPSSTPAQFRLFLQQPELRRGDHHVSGTLRDPTTTAWFRSRLRQLYPRRTPHSLEITWDERRHADDRAAEERTTPVARLVVPLEG